MLRGSPVKAAAGADRSKVQRQREWWEAEIESSAAGCARTATSNYATCGQAPNEGHTSTQSTTRRARAEGEVASR